MSDEQDVNRRGFLKGAATGMAAVAGGLWVASGLESPPEVVAKPITDPAMLRKNIVSRYRKLGKTGKMVSTVGIGTATITSAGVLDRAIDLGLNFVDTAHCYAGGKSELELGKVLRKRRKEVVLTTKWHSSATTRKEELLKSLDASLKSLRVDHVDNILVHSVKDPAWIKNPEVREAFQIAKKAGKVSHLGMSSHSPTLVNVVREAAKTGWYDLVLLKYSYMSYPEIGTLIDELYAKDIAITVMKTRDGARHVGLDKFDKGDGFASAALRWAISNPKIASAFITVETFEEAEAYARAASQELTSLDRKMLQEYAAMFDQTQCRWCGDCGDACAAKVPVWEVDRASMYYERYKQERRGMRLYASLGEPAQACVGCAAPCESACSYQLPIQSQMLAAHSLLSWRPPLDEHRDRVQDEDFRAS